MEIVDLYEEDIARVADQVLSTYLLYKAFIQDQALDFSVVLTNFFDTRRYGLGGYRLKDAVYPILEAFNHRFVSERLQKHIDRKWELVKNDEENLLKLMAVFWFLRETHTLFHLKERVDRNSTSKICSSASYPTAFKFEEETLTLSMIFLLYRGASE